MAELNLVDTKLTLKFEDQSYSNSNINNAATDETIYHFADMMKRYQVSAASEIIKSVKFEFIN